MPEEIDNPVFTGKENPVVSFKVFHPFSDIGSNVEGIISIMGKEITVAPHALSRSAVSRQVPLPWSK